MCKNAASTIATVVNPITSITSGLSGINPGGLFGGGPSAPNVPNAAQLPGTVAALPSVPDFSPQELQALQNQGITIEQINGILTQAYQGNSQAQNILRQFSGIYDGNGNINQDAVKNLNDQIQSTMGQTASLNNQALDQLKNSFNQSPLQGISDQVGQAEATRLLDALKGTGPSASLTNQEQQDFEKLREAAGQRGIKLEGDNLFTATSQSTAGNQLLADLRKNAETRRDSERNTIIDQATNANLNRLGFGLNQSQQQYNQAQGLRSNPADMSLGFLNQAQQSSPANLFDQYSQLNQLYGSNANPYSQQRLLGFDQANNQYNTQLNRDMYNNQLQNAQITGQYNADLSNYQQNIQNRNALLGTIGTIGGGIVGGMFGGPVGAGIGSQVGKGVMTTQVEPKAGMGFSYGNRNPYNNYAA